jgi:hypothetical protein
VKLAATRRRNTLQRVFDASQLQEVWKDERKRFLSSCYGYDRISGRQYDAERAWRIPSIRERRLKSPFKPHVLLAIARPKKDGGHRIICVPTVEDRLVQFSILSEIRDKLKARGLLNEVSYGLTAHASRTVQDARGRATYLREAGGFVYKTDIQKFFDRIPRETLKAELRRVIADRSLHTILESFVDVEIGDGFAPNWQQIVDAAGIKIGEGVRQGMPLSPYFAGIILQKLDKDLERRNFPVIRYVDDIIGFFRSQGECENFDKYLRDKLGELQLTLGSIGEPKSKTIIYQPDESADFLGMEMKFDINGRCLLSVGEKTIEGIEANFAAMANIEHLLQKKLTLPNLGARIQAMERGYIAAYHGAENMSELKQRIHGASESIVENVLEEIFGAAVERLTPKQKRFLGID